MEKANIAILEPRRSVRQAVVDYLSRWHRIVVCTANFQEVSQAILGRDSIDRVDVLLIGQTAVSQETDDFCTGLRESHEDLLILSIPKSSRRHELSLPMTDDFDKLYASIDSIER